MKKKKAKKVFNTCLSNYLAPKLQQEKGIFLFYFIFFFSKSFSFSKNFGIFSSKVERTKEQLTTNLNRIKANPKNSNVVAAFGEDKTVFVFNITSQLSEFKKSTQNFEEMLEGVAEKQNNKKKPQDHIVYKNSKSHQTEGFAVCWSSVESGAFYTGDNKGKIVKHIPSENTWKSSTVFIGHTASVEGFFPSFLNFSCL